MRRHPDERRLATMVRRGDEVERNWAPSPWCWPASTLGRAGSRGGRRGAGDAITARWAGTSPNQAVCRRRRPARADAVAETARLATDFIAGRAVLFARRIAEHKIVDGHADLLADDIFCLDDGPALLDCLEFDDRLRYVDVIDDAAFLAMDLEFLGRPDLGRFFLQEYPAVRRRRPGRAAGLLHRLPRGGARQGRLRPLHPGSRQGADDARAHLDIARRHLRSGAVRLILVGGGPGTGKTTLARSLAERIGAEVVSTDDVRADMVRRGELTGSPGTLDGGLYSTGQRRRGVRRGAAPRAPEPVRAAA